MFSCPNCNHHFGLLHRLKALHQKGGMSLTCAHCKTNYQEVIGQKNKATLLATTLSASGAVFIVDWTLNLMINDWLIEVLISIPPLWIMCEIVNFGLSFFMEYEKTDY